MSPEPCAHSVQGRQEAAIAQSDPVDKKEHCHSPQPSQLHGLCSDFSQVTGAGGLFSAPKAPPPQRELPVISQVRREKETECGTLVWQERRAKGKQVAFLYGVWRLLSPLPDSEAKPRASGVHSQSETPAEATSSHFAVGN